MKFTPSAKFLRLASSTFKMIELKAYFRKTTSLSTALDTGAWIDASAYLQDPPEFISQIEYGIGQFSADSIQLIGSDIVWWESHLFTATDSQYIECKIELRVGEDPLNFADDIVYYMSGMVDKRTIMPSEADDSFSFTVDTADVLADRMLAEFISTQYYDPINGVVLFAIPGVYITSTNTGTNPIAAGIHKISYDYNDGNPQARLDDGLWVNIASDGLKLLTDAKSDTVEKQRLQIKVINAQLARDSADRSEKIILQTSPLTLPSTWYTGISLRGIMRAMYNAIGITNKTFDLAQVATFDGSRRLSMLEFVADGQTDKGLSMAIVGFTQYEIYVANGRHVFYLNTQTGTVTAVCSVTAGDHISKLLYDELHGHLWILHGSTEADNYGGRLSRYDIDDITLSSPVTVTDARFFNLELFDFIYSGGGSEYCLLYPVNDDGTIMRVDGISRAVTTLFTRSALGYTSSYGPLRNYAYKGRYVDTMYYRFQVITGSGPGVHEIAFDSSGTSWHDNAITGIHLPFTHTIGAYDPVANNIYGVDHDQNKIRGYSAADGAPFPVWTLQTDDVVGGLYHDGINLYYTTSVDRQVHKFDGDLTETYGVMMYTMGCSFVTTSGVVYGVDHVGRLFQISTSLELFLDVSSFEGRTIKNAITDALRACNCVGMISAAKKAIVYRRGDADGTPITSGNAISITVDNASDIERDPNYAQAFDIIEIDNGKVKMNFNGTDYDVMPASMTERILKIQNTLIPSNVIRDYLKMFHAFFSIGRVLYTFPVQQTLFHIEPMDEANVMFTITKIPVSASHCPIYSVTYSATDGTMKVGVLV